jgi:hypothetical protein
MEGRVRDIAIIYKDTVQPRHAGWKTFRQCLTGSIHPGLAVVIRMEEQTRADTTIAARQLHAQCEVGCYRRFEKQQFATHVIIIT